MDEPRYILAFDTSLSKGRCSLFCPAEEAEEEALLSEEIRISRTLLPQVEQILKSRNIRAHMIQAIGVSIGPGTFTGLRVGLSSAEGLSLGWDCPLYGFSSLEIMAMATLQNAIRTTQNLPDYILPYRDARYGELFTALFQVTADPVSSLGFTLTRVREDEVISLEEFCPPAEGDTLLTGRKEELPENIAFAASHESGSHHEMDCSAAATAWLTYNALQNRSHPNSTDISLNYCRKSQAQTKWPERQG